jgi:hypothetical protein
MAAMALRRRKLDARSAHESATARRATGFRAKSRALVSAKGGASRRPTGQHLD